jgi:hypothetical protein
LKIEVPLEQFLNLGKILLTVLLTIVEAGKCTEDIWFGTLYVRGGGGGANFTDSQKAWSSLPILVLWF